MNNIVSKIGLILITGSLMFSGLAFAEKGIKKVAVIQDLMLSDDVAILDDGQTYLLDHELVYSLYDKKRDGGWDWSVGKPVVIEVKYGVPGKPHYRGTILSIDPPLKKEEKK